MGNKIEIKTKKAMKRINKKIFLDFLFYTLLSLFVAVFMQMGLGAHWLIYLPLVLAAGIITTRIKDKKQIKLLSDLMNECTKCGHVNRKNAAYCSKCGALLRENLEVTVRVYTGNLAEATIIVQMLKDNKISAWKNNIYTGLPASVYVFERDAERAVKIVKQMEG
jgi:hypothetical protein